MINDSINRFLAVLSYPFVSLDFLRCDYLQAYLDIEEPETKSKKDIRAHLVKHVKRNYPIYSYDEINLYLDKWYLYPLCEGNPDRGEPKEGFILIFKLLDKMSKSLISQRDGQFVYKYWESEGDNELLGGFSGSNKIYLFHSINRLFPIDILVSLYMIRNQKPPEDLDNFYGNIKVSDTLLAQRLKKGIAENHLHSGVSSAFLTLWDSFMQPLTKARVKELKNFSLVNSFDIDREEIQTLLYLAGIGRAVISMSLRLIKDGKSKKNNLGYMKPIVSDLLFLCETKEKWKSYYEFQTDESSWDSSSYFIRLWDELREWKLFHIVYQKPDFLNTSEEALFLYEVLPLLINNWQYSNQELKVLRTLFLNYLRIKNFFYELIVQQKTINGLDYFSIQYYRNNSAANSVARNLDGVKKWERVIQEQLQNEELKKLELRASIIDNENKFKIMVLDFLRAYRNILRKSYCMKKTNREEIEYQPVRQFPRIGLVFHLLKREQDYLPEKCLQWADDNDYSYLQYGKTFKIYQNQVRIFKDLRKEKGFDKYLVGLDVASLENAMPTWVFASLYEEARDSRDDPVRNGCYQSVGFQSLGFTFHAGEDFRHLLSGIRHIDEAVRYLKFHAGDRIGHGIALGISAMNWYENNATVIIPRIEALENYLWCYHLLSQNCTDSSLINLAYLERRIYELAKEIYGDGAGLSVNTLVDGYVSLFKQGMFSLDFLETCNQCDPQAVDKMPQLCRFHADTKTGVIWNKAVLLEARHCKHYVSKMNQPIHYYVSKQEMNIVSEVQRLIKQYIMQQGIIIEVNPSSNVAIGMIDTLAEHQIYNLNQGNYDMGNILTCINSDDPSVFNTNVYNELAYIYFAMLEKGVGREALLAWIDKLRISGLEASFIRRSDSDEEILRELDEILGSD